MEHVEHPSPEEQLRQEIEEARLGLRPYVSRKAAAWYLDIHHVTLSKMHCRGDGPRTVVHNPEVPAMPGSFIGSMTWTNGLKSEG